MVDETGTNGNGMPNWDDLQGMWQDTPPVDMAKMARNAQFVWWRMRVNFVVEILMSVVGVILFGSFVDFVSLSSTLLGLLGMFYCSLTVWAAVHIRRGAWDDHGEDTLSLVRLQIRRARSTLLYIKLNSWFGYAGIVMVPLGYWVLFDQFGTFDHERMQIVNWVFGGLILFIFGFPLAMRPIVKKKKQEIADLEEVEKQLSEEEAV